MLLEKRPVPLPSEVWLSFTVGLCEVLQQTPRAVTDEPPLPLTKPAQVADVDKMVLNVLVVTQGTTKSALSIQDPL